MRIAKMLPFLEKEELSELLEAIVGGELKEESISVTALYPFLENDQLKSLFDRAVSGEVKVKPVSILPFLDEGDYESIIDKLAESDLETISIEEIIPFLSEANIKKVFRIFLEKEKKQQ